MPDKQPTIGGSAALEGVMMRGPEAWALAVRQPDGTIAIERHARPAPSVRYPWLKLPLIRGIATLIESLSVSYTALARSAILAGVEDDKPPSQTAIYVTIGISAVIGILLFAAGPAFLAGLLVDAGVNPVLFNVTAGLLKGVLIVSYVYAISLMPDIRRFFQYHGAEHKAIAAFEAGGPLSVDEARKMTPYHPRCGTSFIAFVVLVAIVFFTFIPGQQEFWWRIGSRILFFPLVAALAYELIRLTAFTDNPVSRVLRRPGFAFQRLTVREPDDSMLEVSLASLRAALGIPQPETAPPGEVAAVPAD